MFNVSIIHQSDMLIGGVEFSAPNLFSAYRLAWSYIKTDGSDDSTYRIDCNGKQMCCKRTINIDAVKQFFSSVESCDHA